MAKMFPLPVLLELQVNGNWRDITRYLYTRDPIVITGGSTDPASGSVAPATCSLTLDNRDGRFTPSYASGAFFPDLVRNMQIRVSLVNATSSSGNTYTGYRFWGSVPSWPPVSDVSGSDIYVQIVASGPSRQFNQGGGKDSALARYYGTLTGSYAPIAYWPCEEDRDNTGTIGTGVPGGTAMTVLSGTPKWKAISKFNGSAPIGIVNGSVWDGLTGQFANGGGDDLYNTVGSFTWVAPVPTVNCKVWAPGDTGGGFLAHGGVGGGGGEFAQNTALAVTVGQGYTFAVTSGGSQNDMTFAGDVASVTAHAAVGATGGSGSTAPVHFSGGTGGTSISNAGGGGGGSGGTAAAGNNGGATSNNNPGIGATAVTGGGNGGSGASGIAVGSGIVAQAGGLPGGGGGGAGASSVAGGGRHGQVELVYTPATSPPANVLRFIVYIPTHGHKNGAVLVRALSGGTIAQLDVVYATGGKVRLKGYDNTITLLFTSSTLTIGDGQTVMVSAELTPSGTAVAYKLRAVLPGATTQLGTTVTGSQASATLGNVTEVLVGPNGDVTKIAIGHVSVQYAVVALLQVSRALAAHDTEMGVDRFIRLANEQAMGALPEYTEGNDHWGFESGTQSWVATNGALTNPTTSVIGNVGAGVGEMNPDVAFWAWPPEGSHSLLMTCNGVGAPIWRSPGGLSGQPVSKGDIVTAHMDIYVPVALAGNIRGQINWYDNTGATLSTTTGPGLSTSAGTIATIKVKGTAPNLTAFFSVQASSDATEANLTKIYTDNVRVHPQLGIQVRKAYKELLEEIKDLDQGIMKEAKALWGMGYRTRLRMLNQSPAITLDYTKSEIVPPLTPVVDDAMIKNDVTVKRHKGSSVRITATSGGLGSNIVGNYKKKLKIAATDDAQLAAHAAQLLAFSTSLDERYPTISVELARAGKAGASLAPLMSAVAAVDIGDYVKIINLPFWFPNQTVKQLVIGYHEVIDGDAQTWNITWNCVPEGPFEVTATAIRRW